MFRLISPKPHSLPSSFNSLLHFSTTISETQVETIFHLITTSTPPHSLQTSLTRTNIPITHSLIEKVLKRVRFTHSNPLQALTFFNYHSNINHPFFIHTPLAYDTMLYILGRSRKFDHVYDVLYEMRRKDKRLVTTRTINVVLARVAKVCSVRMTVEWFRKFKKLIPPSEIEAERKSEYMDVSCYNALLRCVSQEKSMSDARKLYHKLKHEFRPNLVTFNILLSGWQSSEDAEGFFEEMMYMGVKPDIVSYNCLVDVHCRSREMEKAYKVMEKMRSEEIWPDVFTYTSLIGGLGLMGEAEKSRDLLKEMKECGCYPDVPAYNAVIRNFCIARKIRDAVRLMEEMTEKRLNPNATTYNLFFRVFYWSNDLNSLWSLYERMMENACLPNTQSCMFLIRLLRRQEKVDMAVKLWNDMVEKGFGSFTLVSDVLFDLLCDMGKLDEAEKCFLQMVGKGQKPSNVAYRRIKVLMELANRSEALRNLTEKMALFGSVYPKQQIAGDDLTMEHISQKAAGDENVQTTSRKLIQRCGKIS